LSIFLLWTHGGWVEGKYLETETQRWNQKHLWTLLWCWLSYFIWTWLWECWALIIIAELTFLMNSFLVQAPLLIRLIIYIFLLCQILAALLLIIIKHVIMNRWKELLTKMGELLASGIPLPMRVIFFCFSSHSSY